MSIKPEPRAEDALKRVMARIEKNRHKYRYHGSVSRTLDSIDQILLSELRALQNRD